MGMNKAVLALSLVMAVFVVGSIGAAVIQLTAAAGAPPGDDPPPSASASASPDLRRTFRKPTKIRLEQWFSSTKQETNVSRIFTVVLVNQTPSPRARGPGEGSGVTPASNTLLEPPYPRDELDARRTSAHCFPAVKKIRIGEWESASSTTQVTERAASTEGEQWSNDTIHPEIEKRSNAEISLQSDRNSSKPSTET